MLPTSPFLYPILDADFSSDPVADARTLIRAGIKIFQLRAKNLTPADLFQIIQNLIPVCREANVQMMINDSVDLTLVTDDTGVHLGQDDFPLAEARRLLPDRIIGVSTHSIEQLMVAASSTADYIAIGPIFPTSTKRDAADVLGVDFVHEARSRIKRPLVCVGGIRGVHFRELVAAGADGIALISELYRGGDLHTNVSRLLEELKTSA